VITDGSSVDGKDQADWNLSDVVLRNARASLPSRDFAESQSNCLLSSPEPEGAHDEIGKNFASKLLMKHQRTR
jgi:hypothetical protein